jgi:hypothetical protein
MYILALLAAIVGGLAFILLLEGDWTWPERVGAAIVLGLTLQALLAFALASWFGLGTASIALAAALSLAPLALLRRRRMPPGRRRPSLGGLVYALLVSGGLVAVFDRAYFEPNGAVATGVDHNLGDLPFHLAVATSFAFGENLPPEHPELAGVRLTYPFLADFGAAVLARAGAGLRASFFAQNALLALALLACVHRFAFALTGDRLAARLAPLLLFLNGGLGFLLFFREASAGGAIFELLGRLGHDYTITGDGLLRFGNSLIVLFIPQRALLLGVPLALLVLTQFWETLKRPAEPRDARGLALAGAVAGLMPLAHSHAFAVVLGMAACLAGLFPRRAWLAFFAVAGLLAGPQVLWAAHGSALRTHSFVAWHLGWDRGDQNALFFWLMNTGVFIPLLIVATLRFAPAGVARFLLPTWGLFLVPNLLRLSPWIWDNIKFLIFFFLAGLPLVAALLARLLRGRAIARAGGAVLLACLTLSGALDVWRVASRQIALTIVRADGAAFARGALPRTPPRSLILHAPTYDSPVALSGRRSLLGYPGHIWSQGLDGGTREADIARIYAGDAQAPALLDRYGVDYILVGPEERARLAINEFFLSRYPIVEQSGGYVLRRVR